MGPFSPGISQFYFIPFVLEYLEKLLKCTLFLRKKFIYIGIYLCNTNFMGGQNIYAMYIEIKLFRFYIHGFKHFCAFFAFDGNSKNF